MVGCPPRYSRSYQGTLSREGFVFQLYFFPPRCGQKPMYPEKKKWPPCAGGPVTKKKKKKNSGVHPRVSTLIQSNFYFIFPLFYVPSVISHLFVCLFFLEMCTHRLSFKKIPHFFCPCVHRSSGDAFALSTFFFCFFLFFSFFVRKTNPERVREGLFFFFAEKK